MFSNRVCVSDTKSLVLSELQSAGNLTTHKLHAHGLTWNVLYLWRGNDRISYKVGLALPDYMVGAAVQTSVVVHSSSARLRRTCICGLIWADAQHSIWLRTVIVHPSQMQLLAENGALKITITLEVFEPVKFRSISPAAVYHTSAPSQCVVILGVDEEGSVYVLLLRELTDQETGQYCIYCFRPFLPHNGIILARFQQWPGGFRGSGFDRGNKRLAVTQVYDNNSSLQLDVVDWESREHTTRTYRLEEEDLEWSAATPHKRGWLCIASGVRDDPPPHTVHHQFWLLGDDSSLNLLTELVKETDDDDPCPAASFNGGFYCLCVRKCHVFMWVCSWEQPNNWQPYEFAPYPDFDEIAICYAWGQMLLVGEIFNKQYLSDDECQFAFFKLRFESSDCFVEPYVVLPKGICERNWKIGGNSLVVFDQRENLIKFIGINELPTLKIGALKAQQDAHKDWREKLTQILGQATNSYLS